MSTDAIERARLFDRDASRPARERAAKGLRRLRRQALDLAASAQDTAKDIAEAAQDRARDLMDSAQGRARHAAEAARERARTRLEHRRDAAVEAIEEIASNLRPRAKRLAREVEGSKSRSVARMRGEPERGLSLRGQSTIMLAGALSLGVALGIMVSSQVRARRAKKAAATGVQTGAVDMATPAQLTPGQRLEGNGAARESVAASPTTQTPFT